MTTTPQRPRRAAARWLEGAPEYVIACYDNRGKTADRYTVLFGGSMWTPDHARQLAECGMDTRLLNSLSMSDNPTHPQGVSQYDYALRGSHLGRKVRWNDLPDHIRNHVIDRAEEV
jgi:hypothetical protein